MQAGFLADLAAIYPDLDPSFLRDAGREFDLVHVAGGEALVRMGEPSDALFILMRGRLVATVEDEQGRPVRLREMGRGEIIGEMSVLTGGTRTATVTAVRDCQLVRVSKDAFLRFMQHHPSVMRQFVQVLIQRLSRRETRRVEKLATIALLPAGRGGDVRPFAVGLARALARCVTVLVLDREAARSRYPGTFDAASDAEIAAWLNDLELEHGMLLYIPDAAESRWSQQCLRQADRVLLLGRAGDDPAPNAVEARVLGATSGEGLRGCELVLVHATGQSLPNETAAWLDKRSVQCHHHLPEGDPAALERLCRHLLGRSVGLVLGGGGARAITQIGVLRALQETKIPVDAIGGTSMGAVVGALAALGKGADDVRASMHEALRLKPFSGITPPFVSLLSGKRLARMMGFLFGDVRIEDLWKRYFCVSCSLTRGAIEVSSSGNLAKWVTASNAVPGIVPPVLSSGELLVDGGLLNNLPADVMASRNAGPVIAINVSGVAELRADIPDDADLSGWSVLLEGVRQRRASEQVPGLSRILTRSMLLASGNHAQSMRAHAALYLTPPVTGVDPNDWHAFDDLVESGYHYAMEALERWDRRADVSR